MATLAPLVRRTSRRPLRMPRPSLSTALVVAGSVLVPWMFVLAATLPATAEAHHWTAAWVGLDAALAAGLAGTGLLRARRDPRHVLTAAATSALLLMDAWFDTMTAAPGAETATALALALCAEIPLALLCARLAVRGMGRADLGRPGHRAG
ncbi:LPXTG cell wall anchor domain-containing protein [Streptomyces sp. NPDC006197]|uniref:LPXTG cell wall anchor domain-containing protein n=1 Tax=Streptomyces sp. NPDC006197 TaxID=3156685 RepID=UPI0033B8F380